MEQKTPFISLPEFTELTYEDKLDHYMMIRYYVTEDEQTQLACLTRLRKTFQVRASKPKKD